MTAQTPSEPLDTVESGPGRLDPTRSTCVLIGVDDYQDLPNLRSVERNLDDLKRTLTDPDVWGVSEDRVRVVRNPSRAGDLTGPVREAAEQAEDTLLVYYAGHGLLEFRDDQLYLTLTTSVHGRRETSLAYGVLREILRDSRESAKRRIVILDCCYSGKALEGAMAGAGTTVPDKRQVEIEGSYVLTSTTDVGEAKAPPRAMHTAFTGALIDVLANGDAENEQEELLTLNQVYGLLKKRLSRKGLPEPQRLDENGVGNLLFVRNRQSPRTAPQPAASPSLRTMFTATATALLLGLVLGAVSGYQVHEWIAPSTGSASIPGPCDEDGRAQLLDVSDQLDRSPQNEYMGSPVEGLSALALTGDDSQALVLRDNEPAQFFTLTLGGPEDLDPTVTGMTALYGPDGERFEEFDGEGLVIEDGGETILVATESGPSIRRFGIDDGKQIGDGLPLPESFLPAPDGEAQRGRNLESLTVTPDGNHLYTALEGPLLSDEDVHGRHQLRIQRYKGETGGDYELDRQYGYRTEVGLYLVELVTIDEDRLLALERGHLTGLGSSIRVYEVHLGDSPDVTDSALRKDSVDLFARKDLLFDMAACPEGDIVSEQIQQNQILDNVEGMALGPELEEGPHKGHRTLYLVSDNNGRDTQTTRVYSLAIGLD